MKEITLWKYMIECFWPMWGPKVRALCYGPISKYYKANMLN